MQELIHKQHLVWKENKLWPFCPDCNRQMRPSKLEEDKWVCPDCNIILER